MNKAEEYLSQSKYAEHRNVTKGYIGRLVKEGRLLKKLGVQQMLKQKVEEPKFF